jgi:hypothetical protein
MGKGEQEEEGGEGRRGGGKLGDVCVCVCACVSNILTFAFSPTFRPHHSTISSGKGIHKMVLTSHIKDLAIRGEGRGGGHPAVCGCVCVCVCVLCE